MESASQTIPSRIISRIGATLIRPSANRPNPASSAISNGDRREKSAACHSPIWPSPFRADRCSGKSRPSKPNGVIRHDAVTAAATNIAHSTAALPRSWPSITASMPCSPPARPKMKLPCRFAHSGITTISHQRGASFASRASASPAVHAASSGSASRCGRARRLAVTQARPSTTARSAGRKSTRLRTIVTGRRPRSARRHRQTADGCRPSRPASPAP